VEGRKSYHSYCPSLLYCPPSCCASLTRCSSHLLFPDVGYIWTSIWNAIRTHSCCAPNAVPTCWVIQTCPSKILCSLDFVPFAHFLKVYQHLEDWHKVLNDFNENFQKQTLQGYLKDHEDDLTTNINSVQQHFLCGL
jgi:hypothetical protein